MAILGGVILVLIATFIVWVSLSSTYSNVGRLVQKFKNSFKDNEEE